MFGPVEGRQHDAFVLSISGILTSYNISHSRMHGQPYVLYGDPAYGVSQNVISPFRGQQLTQAEEDFNKSMSAVRISVEWTFGKIIQQFAFLVFKKNLKMLLQPIGKCYLVGMLLTNCHAHMSVWITNIYLLQC